MKKRVMLVLLMFFIAAPAFAGITVECNQVKPECSEVIVEVRYAMDTGEEPNLPRAFGIDIYVDNGASIGTIYGFDPNFYVSPWTFDINGGDPNWGIPVKGLDTNSFTIEMASLYAAGDTNHPTPPEPNGVLFSFTLDGDCNIVMEENAGLTGSDSNGVVMENTEKSFPVSYVTLTGCQAEVNECYAGRPDYDQWVEAGKPECWCYPRQCHGDADNAKQGGFVLGYWYVGSDDLDIMSAGWMVKDPLKGPGILGLEFNGVPVACADFKHDKQGGFVLGYWRIGSNDLDEMSIYWMVKEPTKGPGTPADCLPNNRPCP